MIRSCSRGAAELDDAARATIDVSGLEPATSYQVLDRRDTGARIGPITCAPHRATTIRAAVRIAVSADIDPSPEFDSDLIAQLAAASPELFVSLGDFPYTDNGPPAMTVDEYRERHVELLHLAARARAARRRSACARSTTTTSSATTGTAMFAPPRRSRYAAAMQVWDEFFPAPRRRARSLSHLALGRARRVLLARLPAVSQRERRARRRARRRCSATRSARGSSTRVHALDRDVQARVHERAARLRRSGDDHWAAFTTERERCCSTRSSACRACCSSSADQHWFAAHRHAHGIREFQVGPLARGDRAPGPTPPGVAVPQPALQLRADRHRRRRSSRSPGSVRMARSSIRRR